MYSVELYKKDGRVKGGWKLTDKYDTKYTNLVELESVLSSYDPSKYRWTIHETMVTRHHYITKEPFMERYDRPYYCSPSSEHYFSN